MRGEEGEEVEGRIGGKEKKVAREGGTGGERVLSMLHIMYTIHLFCHFMFNIPLDSSQHEWLQD